jgi:hypothetical protein
MTSCGVVTGYHILEAHRLPPVCCTMKMETLPLQRMYILDHRMFKPVSPHY